MYTPYCSISSNVTFTTWIVHISTCYTQRNKQTVLERVSRHKVSPCVPQPQPDRSTHTHTHTHTHSVSGNSVSSCIYPPMQDTLDRTQSSIHPNHNSLLSNDSIILCASVNNPLSLSLSTGSWYQLQHSRSLLQSFQPVHATHSAIAYALSLSTRFTANIMLWEISPHTASHKVPSFPTRYHWQLSF